MKESLLHPVIGSNLLQDIPGKLVVQLIGDIGHHNRDHPDDCRDSDEEWLACLPNILARRSGLQHASFLQYINRRVDLVDLEERIHHEGEVGYAQPDDLNRVLQSERIPC